MDNINSMYSKIPVVIFCGGLGTRLKEETEYKPKPMVEVGGKPILWHIMKIYQYYGYNNFILCLGYKSRIIKQYFLNHRWFSSDFKMKEDGVLQIYKDGSSYKDNFNIIFAETGEATLTGERLKMVEKYINSEEFMVTYGDGVANINIDQLVAFHRDKSKIGTITGVNPSSKYGLVDIDDNNLVLSFEQKPRLNQFINAGFMMFKHSFFKYLKNNQMIEDSLVGLVDKKELAIYKHKDFWHCMDTYKDYQDLNQLWQDDPRWKIWN